jgi:endonuclease YncB( thermonuclease family)
LKQVAALLAIALVSFPAIAQQGTTIIGRPTVVDGDTLEIRGERIRLGGIDAPESRQTCKDQAGATYPCGRRAAAALDEFTAGQGQITCVVSSKDRYGRFIAECFKGRININALMVTAGWAIPYRRYGGDRYATHEASAKAARRGVWQGEFVEPEDFRRRGR